MKQATVRYGSHLPRLLGVRRVVYIRDARGHVCLVYGELCTKEMPVPTATIISKKVRARVSDKWRELYCVSEPGPVNRRLSKPFTYAGCKGLLHSAMPLHPYTYPVNTCITGIAVWYTLPSTDTSDGDAIAAQIQMVQSAERRHVRHARAVAHRHVSASTWAQRSRQRGFHSPHTDGRTHTHTLVPNI